MLGLTLACAGSVFNVLTDASRKKILDCKFDAAMIGFWCKLLALGIYLALFAGGSWFGLGLSIPPTNLGNTISPHLGFVIYLVVNAMLEGTAIFLNYRALQTSPLSFCVPFMALTPLFLLPIGWLFLGEAVSAGMIIGVLLVVVGSLAINRKLVSKGWAEPARAILREKGSRYMALVALILACTAALDKWFINSSGGHLELAERFSRSFTVAIGKSFMLTLFFAAMSWFKARGNRGQPQSASSSWLGAWKRAPKWLLLAALFEAIVLVLQLLAVQFTVTAIVISIKRSGILLACILGWFMFGEREIIDRVIGSVVMMAGVAVFFLTKPDAAGVSLLSPWGAVGAAMIALAGMLVAMRLTRDRVLNALKAAALEGGAA